MKTQNLFTLLILTALFIADAHAAGAGGPAMPWDGVLDGLARNLTGRTAVSVAIIALAGGGLSLIFLQGQMSELVRMLMWFAILIGLVIGAANVVSAWGGAGAVIAAAAGAVFA